MVGPEHGRIIIRLAKKQDSLESRWKMLVARLHEQVLMKIEADIKAGRDPELPAKIFEEFVLSHFMECWGVAADSVRAETAVIISSEPETQLSKRTTPPGGMKRIRELFDRYRKEGKLPKAMKEKAKDIQKNYLKKIGEVWKKHSAEFREGNEYTQESVLRKVQKSADVGAARAQTIVRTSTTNYYNQTRREMYDSMDVVWGYLFLAIRDQGTTKWCTDKVTQGKRGRHGLVYKKGEPLTINERPACHWNCRSEFTPLSVYNPRHLKLIENKKLWRENNNCHPLPPGWRAA